MNRPAVRNAVDGPTATALHAAFVAFEADAASRVAVLTGAGGNFCAGADLKALAEGMVEGMATPNSRVRLRIVHGLNLASCRC